MTIAERIARLERQAEAQAPPPGVVIVFRRDGLHDDEELPSFGVWEGDPLPSNPSIVVRFVDTAEEEENSHE